jgi:hypothetical protein
VTLEPGVHFGYIPPSDRTREELAYSERVEAALIQPFRMTGAYKDEKGRFALWKVAEKVYGGRLKYNWQVTGSCVGAGGGNAAKTRQLVEIALGDLERYAELWWPWTYGQSRKRAGLNGPGEGSFGAAYADAAANDGFFAMEEHTGLVLPEQGGWLQTSKGVELEWSNGAAKAVEPYVSLGKRHPFKSLVRIRTTEEAKAAIAGAKSPLTIASMFGTRGIRPQGSNPAVNIGDYNDRWAHQMWIDEAWDHPDLGLIFRFGNNWGPTAHPQPSDGESPPGGFYVVEATLKKILGERNTECFALADLQGLVSRQLDWTTI